MIKNRWIHIFYRAIYVLLMLFGIADSLGAFTGVLNKDFYAYYTNQSNIICTVIAIAELGIAIWYVSKGKPKGCESPLASVKFLAAIWILITFAVNNVLLGDLSSISYWTDFSNVVLHFAGPLLFIFDYLFFTQTKVIKWTDIAWVISYPYLYVIFALVRGALIDPSTTSVVYPYFFLDPTDQGYAYVIVYVFILTIVFLLLGLVFALINHIGKRRDPKF